MLEVLRFWSDIDGQYLPCSKRRSIRKRALSTAVAVLLTFSSCSRPTTTTQAWLPATTYVNISYRKTDQKAMKNLSRRETLLIGTGGLIYGKVLGDAIGKLAQGDVRPEEHESRVKRTFAEAFELASRSSSEESRRPIRVLELGIGSEIRTINRGLYDEAVTKIISSGYNGIELVGVDLDGAAAKDVSNARSKLLSSVENAGVGGINVDLKVLQSDVENIAFPNGYFDVVTCCLVLCSVENQVSVLKEVKRLLRPKGTFGWVEHVAVQGGSEGHDFLAIQQIALDPLQQAVAHNCHLHRETNDVILEEFNMSTKTEVERFFVDGMWPVSCQARGVVVNL
uniref:Methyltransferase type 11 domain-containing protein n=1 Tax=Leptocylindrus danicus TaxID=163516 RepID=A0A7S2NWG2_9STRA|mmetsp:Transcript_16292/g.24002  ORF Transcript_16292/g.24002 Transcript_16292/m.24002 type:complete len:339 (+) Transcript_16292:115-1131(+)